PWLWPCFMSLSEALHKSGSRHGRTPGKTLQKLPKGVVQGGADMQRLRCNRVGQMDISGRQQQAVRLKLSLEEAVVVALAMFRIANDRVVDMFQMPTDLMLSAGNRLTGHQ